MLNVGNVGGVGRVGLARGTGVRGPWVATETYLRALYAANAGLDTAHTLAEMASPPTITVTGSTANPVGMGVSYTYASGSVIPLYLGGAKKTLSTNYCRFPNVSDPVGGGNVAGNESATTWRVSVRTTSAKVAFSLMGGSYVYRFLARAVGGIDQYVSKSATVIGSNTFVVLDFGTDADRVVTVESQQASAFRAVNVLDGLTASTPTVEPSIVLFLGDSITAGTPGPSTQSDGLVNQIAERLGFANFWASGLGGTGYVATNSGSRPKLADRLAADLARAAAAGTVKKVFVMMGVNDEGLSGVDAQAAACFDAIRAALPAASISVASGYDRSAPSAPTANFTAVKSAIRAAIEGRKGVHFLDLQGVSYTKSDGTHATDTGAATLGAAIVALERLALGA